MHNLNLPPNFEIIRNRLIFKLKSLPQANRELLVSDTEFAASLVSIMCTRGGGELRASQARLRGPDIYFDIIKDCGLLLNSRGLLCNAQKMLAVAEQYPQYFTQDDSGELMGESDLIEACNLGVHTELELIRTGLLLGFPHDSVLGYAYHQSKPADANCHTAIISLLYDSPSPLSEAERHLFDRFHHLSVDERLQVAAIIKRYFPNVADSSIEYTLSSTTVTLPNQAQFVATIPLSSSDDKHCFEVTEFWDGLNIAAILQELS